jgi:protein-S-isoprenylcysteine O-methyltransferase Ste14
MHFDLRLPIGYLFTILGAMLVLVGLFTANSDMYQHSLGININIWWGAVLLIFGLLMALAAWKSHTQVIQQVREAAASQGQSSAKK